MTLNVYMYLKENVAAQHFNMVAQAQHWMVKYCFIYCSFKNCKQQNFRVHYTEASLIASKKC